MRVAVADELRDGLGEGAGTSGRLDEDGGAVHGVVARRAGPLSPTVGTPRFSASSLTRTEPCCSVEGVGTNTQSEPQARRSGASAKIGASLTGAGDARW